MSESVIQPVLKKRRGRPSLYLSVMERLPKGQDGSLPSGLLTAPDELHLQPKRRRKTAKNNAQESAFRKFYEAGGRDYKQFLQWKAKLDEHSFTNLTKIDGNPSKGTPSHWTCSPFLPTTPSTLLPSLLPYWPAPLTQLYPPIWQQQNILHRPYLSDEERLKQSPKSPLSATSPSCVGSASPDTTSPKSTASSPPSNYSPTPFKEPKSALYDWSAEEVAEFVKSVPGCDEYAKVFLQQSIDGRILPHLTEEHLLNFFGMKLGPAIHLRIKLNELIKN